MKTRISARLRALTLAAVMAAICLSTVLSTLYVPAEAKTKRKYHTYKEVFYDFGKGDKLVKKTKQFVAYEKGGNVYFPSASAKLENASILDDGMIALGTKVVEPRFSWTGQLALGLKPTGSAARWLPARRKDPFCAGAWVGKGKYEINFFDCAVARERFSARHGRWTGLIKIMPGRQYVYVRYKRSAKWKILIRDYTKK